MKRPFYIVLGVLFSFVMVTLAAVRPSPIRSAEEEISQLYLPVVKSIYKPTLAPFISDMDPAPVVTDIVDPGDMRLFIVEREGRIMISAADGILQPDLLLDIRDRVFTDGNEMGLLGLAVHPNFSSNGQIYVHYTERLVDAETLKEDYFSIIARYLVGANGIADPATEKRILRINLPTTRHHGGALQFGPLDGYLYLSFGDGGTAGDRIGNAQSKDTLLGKILRIDVDGGDPYAIPADNPFVNEDGSLGEIWALGFRNPWRFSFDRQTGDMFIGDVGEFTWEEIDYIPAGSSGGENFGWPCMEGPEVFNPDVCDPGTAYTPPIFFYLQDQCAAVAAGYMYRGTQIPDLYGHFLLADLCKGTMWSLRQDEQGGWHSWNYGDYGHHFTTFGERSDGELFVGANRNKNIYQIVAPGG